MKVEVILLIRPSIAHGIDYSSAIVAQVTLIEESQCESRSLGLLYVLLLFVWHLLLLRSRAPGLSIHFVSITA